MLATIKHVQTLIEELSCVNSLINLQMTSYIPELNYSEDNETHLRGLELASLLKT